MGEMISNLYKIRWREEKSKYKKEEMMRYNGKVKSSREIKKQKWERKSWKKCNNSCGLTGRRKVSDFVLFFK